jgi:hypothetical protein
MGHSAPNPSDNTIIHPSSLAERLKKVAADAERLGLAQTGEVSITGPDLVSFLWFHPRPSELCFGRVQ